MSVLALALRRASRDSLVLLRRAAGRRPLFVGLERSLPDGLGARDERLFQAFRQRYERLAAASSALSLERLCEQIVAEHDYDLAVLAQWDGRRRYANLRKLMRLARSYEELRGREVEGFVRFVAEQDATGARELEAAAEEEGADVVRLLTIHAAKGLEFKVAGCHAVGAAPLHPTDPGSAGRRSVSRHSPHCRRQDASATGRARRSAGEERLSAGPLLRRHDAGNRPADRVGLARPGQAPFLDADRWVLGGWASISGAE